MLSCSSVVAGAGRCVNRGFRKFEKTVARRLDAASRRLGPLFVGLAVALISASAFAFFEASRLVTVLRMTVLTVLTRRRCSLSSS